MSKEQFEKLNTYLKNNPTMSKTQALKNNNISQATYYNWAAKHKKTTLKPEKTTNTSNGHATVEVIENLRKIASGLRFFNVII